jgi:hypothetical protein
MQKKKKQQPPKKKKQQPPRKVIATKHLSQMRGVASQNRARKSNLSMPGGAGVMSVAASYGSVVPGVSLSFLKSKNTNCMRIHMRNFLGSCGVTSGGNTVFNIVGNTGTFSNGGQWYNNPANSAYWSACPIVTMSGFFQKYYINSLKLIFYAKQSTGSNGDVTTGTMDEPEFFESSGVASNVTNPTKLLVTQMFAGKTINVWVPSFDVPFRTNPKQVYYVRAGEGTGNLYSFAEASADQRLCYSNCAGIVYDGVALPGTGNLFYHDVYLEVDMELCDLSSNFSVAPTLSKGRGLLARLEKLEERLNSEKKESKEISKDSFELV